jgi:hypothetical protein
MALRVRILPGAWMSVVSVVCCQMISASALSLFRGVLPTVVCLSVIAKPRQWGGTGSLRAVAPWGRGRGGVNKLSSLSERNLHFCFKYLISVAQRDAISKTRFESTGLWLWYMIDWSYLLSLHFVHRLTCNVMAQWLIIALSKVRVSNPRPAATFVNCTAWRKKDACFSNNCNFVYFQYKKKLC